VQLERHLTPLDKNKAGPLTEYQVIKLKPSSNRVLSDAQPRMGKSSDATFERFHFSLFCAGAHGLACTSSDRGMKTMELEQSTMGSFIKYHIDIREV
jgi:hypothetical protein